MQIVAPAGNIACLMACIKAGADAVYLGLPDFGARQKADNFDKASFKTAVETAHLFDTKVFITLNTLIKDNEVPAALDAAKFAYACGVDAAIVQDIRFIRALKQTLPDLTLHASTQMGIHNAEGARALRSLGISRAVLSRETLPEDIKRIAETGIEIEFFVQGALCVAFSGNCYFSSLASSYSGNRGKCMQLCRKPYVFNGERGYFLSAKDIFLYDRLKQLEELGVSAIKIEGRMRSPEYAYTAVKVYSSNMPANKAKDALKAVYNRGDYCSAYLDGNGAHRAVYSKSQANIGTYIGKIDFVRGRNIKINDFNAHNGDGFKVMRGGKEVCGATAHNGVITADGSCLPGDELRRTFDSGLSESIAAVPERKLPVKVSVKAVEGVEPQVNVVSDKAKTVTVGERVTQTAQSRPIDRSDIIKAFSKTGDFPFDPDISSSLGNVFLPISELNELRRRAYADHKEKILDNYTVKHSSDVYSGLDFNRFNGKGVIMMVEDSSLLTSDIISKADYIALNPRDYRNFDIPDINKPVLLNAPVIARGEDIDIITKAIARKGIYGVISNNLYTISLTDKPILLGTGHNIIGKTDMPHIASFEADRNTGGFVYSFGYAPLMTLCHCSYDKCINCPGNDILTDEAGRKFSLRRYKVSRCYRQLLNCVPLMPKIDNKNKFYDFTAVSQSDMLRVLNGEYSGEYTRGNYNKGLK